MNAISIQELLTYGGGILLALSALIEIAPIKVNPWSKLAGLIGKAINKDVMDKLEQMELSEKQTQARLEAHIKVDDDRNADTHRERILRFNTELMRKLPHTREDYIEVLAEIDAYEQYCREHPDYPNNRATHAVKNIERQYDFHLEAGDFFENGEV